MTRFVWLFSVLALWLLSACGSYTEVDSADYVLTVSKPSIQQIPRVSLKIDRDSNTATLRMEDGTVKVLQLEMKKQEQWLQGCPGNFAASTMQTLRLKTNQIKLGTFTIEDPILYMNCVAPQPTGRETQLVLRSGSILKERTIPGTCAQTNGYPDPNCLTFVKTR